MKYIKVIYTLVPYNEDVADVMIAQLGEYDFESFLQTETGFEAYVQKELFRAEVLETISTYAEGYEYTCVYEDAPDEDWNKVWEENFFEPKVVEGKYIIKSPFHTVEDNGLEPLIIRPQMAFGTGHHETTSVMMHYIINSDVKGKHILDMGCGTGILGIVALKEGAKSVHGIDIDDWCIDNTMENCGYNNVTSLTAEVGGAEKIKDTDHYDMVFANINRNILLRDMHEYCKTLGSGGELIMSGFYPEPDLQMIKDKAAELGMTFVEHKVIGDWCGAKFIKQ